MVDRIGRTGSLGGIRGSQPPLSQQAGRKSGDFSAVLAKQLAGIKFSSHAAARLQSRGINLNNDEMQRLEKAVDLAAKKGAKDALVLVGDVAMVVSVVNRTVVTALDREQARANVFTNIDSAVIT